MVASSSASTDPLAEAPECDGVEAASEAALPVAEGGKGDSEAEPPSAGMAGAWEFVEPVPSVPVSGRFGTAGAAGADGTDGAAGEGEAASFFQKGEQAEAARTVTATATTEIGRMGKKKTYTAYGRGADIFVRDRFQNRIQAARISKNF